MSMLRDRILITVLCLIAVLVMVGVIPAFSQPYATSEKSGESILQIKKPGLNLRKMSLLDPERFTMNHQYMMSFSSMGGSGNLMGMYLNTMEYRFNMPLVMRMRVAYQSQSAQLFGNNNAYSGQQNIDQGRVFVPSFDIVYKPFKNTTIGFFYRDYGSVSPNYYNPYSPFSPYSPYYRFRAMNDWYGYSPYDMRY